MTDLLNAVLQAHGGLDHWRGFTCVEATIVSGGKLWGIKAQPQDPTPRRMTATLQHQWASVAPFGATDQKTDFTPERIAIEKLDGRVVAERQNPRDSYQLRTPWDPLQRAYFNGYALWLYLTTPFLLTLPGFYVTQIDPVEENGEMWAGLQAQYPPGIASHSSLEEFYFDKDHLIRRHDYRVEVAGGFPAIHYVDDIVEADGIKLPTKRRAYRCDEEGRPIPGELMVSIDLSEIHFT